MKEIGTVFLIEYHSATHFGPDDYTQVVVTNLKEAQSIAKHVSTLPNEAFHDTVSIYNTNDTISYRTNGKPRSKGIKLLFMYEKGKMIYPYNESKFHKKH